MKRILSIAFCLAFSACLPAQTRTQLNPAQIDFVARFASPPAAPLLNTPYLFVDAVATGTCSGGGTAFSWCVWNGLAFVQGGGAAVGLGDPGSNSIPYRNAPGATVPANATDLPTQQTGTGALVRTTEAKANETVSIQDFDSLADAMTAASGKVLLIDAAVAVTSSTAIPPGVTVNMAAGGLFTVSSGQVLTINGPFSGDLTQHFAGSGTTVLNSTPVHYPQWWGAQGDLQAFSDGSMTAGLAVWTSTGSHFSAADVGKGIIVYASSFQLVTTIVSYTNPTTIVLGATATGNVTGATCYYGTDDSNSLQAAEDSIVAGAILNTAEGAPAGILFIPRGSYYVSKTISTCHYNSCPAVGGYPAGVINAALTITGEERATTSIYGVVNEDIFQVFGWASDMVIKNLTIVNSGSGANIHILGNTINADNLWLFSDGYDIFVEEPGTDGASNTTISRILCDSPFAEGGPGACIHFALDNGFTDPLALNGMDVHDVTCYNEAWCVDANALNTSVFSNINCVQQGTYCMSLSNAHNVTISNLIGRGYPTTAGYVGNYEQGLILASSSNIIVNGFAAQNYNGSALNVQGSTGVVLNGIAFQNNVADVTTALPYDIYAAGSDIAINGGSVTNSTGHPTYAIYTLDNGSTGSYKFENLKFSGAAYTGTVIDLPSAGFLGVIDNDYFSGVNSTGGSTPTIAVGFAQVLLVSDNLIENAGSPTYWLSFPNATNNTCLVNNFPTSGAILLDATVYPTFTQGCFGSAAAPLTHGVFSTVQASSGILTNPLNLTQQIVTTDGAQSFTNKTFTLSPSAVGQAACWKASGAPGYCSTVVSAGGACTCN